MTRTGTIRCVGGPLDGRDVTVETHPGGIPRACYFLAVVGGKVVTGDDPDAHNYRPLWSIYRPSSQQPDSWPPLYEEAVETPPAAWRPAT